MGIVSDAAQALAALNEEVTREPFEAPREWVQMAVGLKDNQPDYENEPKEMSPGRPHPYHAIKTVFQSLEPGAVVCIDGGEAGGWALQLLEHARASLSMVTTGYLGFLGNGWGYALGAAIGDPTRQVVNMHGDGSAGFHIAELDTYARFGLNILTVVVNNYVWGMSQAGQELMYGGKTDARPASKLSPATRYEVVAEGFGCAGARVDKVEEIGATVRKLSTVEGPALLNLIVSDRPIHCYTSAMVQNTDDPDVIVVPYYDNLPRSRFKETADKGADGAVNGAAVPIS